MTSRRALVVFAAMSLAGITLALAASPADAAIEPAPLTCPPGTVPGWLDENGQPTSCVSDDPCPGQIVVDGMCVDALPAVEPAAPAAQAEPATPAKKAALAAPAASATTPDVTSTTPMNEPIEVRPIFTRIVRHP